MNETGRYEVYYKDEITKKTELIGVTETQWDAVSTVIDFLREIGKEPESIEMLYRDEANTMEYKAEGIDGLTFTSIQIGGVI